MRKWSIFHAELHQRTRLGGFLKQFQQKCAAVLRPELRNNKRLEHFGISKKNGNALAAFLFIFIAGSFFALIKPMPIFASATERRTSSASRSATVPRMAGSPKAGGRSSDDLRDADRGRAAVALLLSLCRRCGPWRALGRQRQHVRRRKRIQDHRRQGLLRARLPAMRIQGI